MLEPTGTIKRLSGNSDLGLSIKNTHEEPMDSAIHQPRKNQNLWPMGGSVKNIKKWPSVRYI